MPQKLDYEYVKDFFSKEGYILLAKTYKNAHQKLKYMCPEGHIGTMTYGNFYQGKRCPRCVGNYNYNINDVKKILEKDSYKLLSNEYINNTTPIKVKCPNGHITYMQFNHFIEGHRCKECKKENYVGPEHHNWNSELTDEERLKGRNFKEYSLWREKVYERDNYTCQICGDDKGGNLVAHHIESYADNEELRTALSNGITLCKLCHNKFHKIYGYGKNTKQQFNAFKKH